jgi:hypothetical protein
MLGAIIALVLLLVIFFVTYRAVNTCHEGGGGVLCKLWHWLA